MYTPCPYIPAPRDEAQAQRIEHVSSLNELAAQGTQHETPPTAELGICRTQLSLKSNFSVEK